MEEIIFSLKHYWRFVDCEAFELKALSQGVGREIRMNTSQNHRSEKPGNFPQHKNGHIDQRLGA